MDGRPELTEAQLEALARLPAHKILQWLKPRQAPKALVLPEFTADAVIESPEELQQAAEEALANMLHLYRYIARGGVEPGCREARDLIWQLDCKKAQALPFFGKLKAVAPDKYTEICGGLEWLYLSPFVEADRTSDPRGKAIADRVCADRSYGRDDRPRRAVESEPPYSYFDFGPKLP